MIKEAICFLLLIGVWADFGPGAFAIHDFEAVVKYIGEQILCKFSSVMGNCYTVGPNEALVRSGKIISYNFSLHFMNNA